MSPAKLVHLMSLGRSSRVCDGKRGIEGKSLTVHLDDVTCPDCKRTLPAIFKTA